MGKPKNKVQEVQPLLNDTPISVEKTADELRLEWALAMKRGRRNFNDKPKAGPNWRPMIPKN